MNTENSEQYAEFDAPVFECEGCGAQAADDGTDALLNWEPDESGELMFCGECVTPPEETQAGAR